ncbi:MAG: tRNA (guanosine(37)-N1)-methyltransferase TrmD [Candidatus Dormibacteraeota bacterium]|nr:tRNA (guanosine(37)-N1)-methyltransferase TrmD [Candidatus Dormibacteraeota bacterium]
MTALRFDLISIFPEVFEPVFRSGVVGRGIRSRLLSLYAHDLRAYAGDPRQVDDAPFGGGPGMVMKPEPIFAAVEAVRSQNPGPVVLMEPWGEPLSQALARELAQEPGMVIVCGRYEGIDDRVRQSLADREISIGDYVLSGGEIPAMVLVDAVARLVPGVVGDEASLAQDAFASSAATGYPQFTRPAEWRGLRVPEVLLSGDHAAIERWRQGKSRTRREREPRLTEKL